MENKCESCGDVLDNGAGEHDGDLWVCDVCARNHRREREKRAKTDTVFVTELMDSSPDSATMQLVVMQALCCYSELVASQPENLLKSMEAGPVGGTSWARSCLEIQRRLNERKGPAWVRSCLELQRALNKRIVK